MAVRFASSQRNKNATLEAFDTLMPKLKPATQTARREHILDAAERCFARTGFHRTTMHDICRLAGISPGALYVYFDSKEALIEGITERDRAEFAEQFARVAEAPDFMSALKTLGDYYMQEDRAHKGPLCVEIGLEGLRNSVVGDIFRRFDREVLDSFERLFRRLQSEGRIAPAMDIPSVTTAFSVLADGLFWRNAVHPAFDRERAMAVVLAMVEQLLRPVAPPAANIASHQVSPS